MSWHELAHAFAVTIAAQGSEYLPISAQNSQTNKYPATNLPNLGVGLKFHAVGSVSPRPTIV